MTRSAAILIFLAPTLLVATRSQDERVFLPDHPGKVAVVINHHGYPGTTAQEREAFDTNLARMRDVLLAGAMFSPPQGVEVTGWLNVNSDPPADPRAPIVGTGFIKFYPYIVQEKTGLPTRFLSTTAEVNVWVNRPDASLEPRVTEGGVRFYAEPERVGEVGGFPVYRRRDGDNLLILTRGTKPPLVPVTREEYVTVYIAYWQKKAASFAGDTISPKIAAAHKAVLDAMSAEERRMPARYLRHNPMEPWLAPVGSSLGELLLKANPDWYDPALPRSAIQVVSLRFQYAGDLNFDRPESTRNVDALRVWQMLRNSDWGAISAAFTRK